MQHRIESPLPLREASLGVSFSPALERIVSKMLSKSPEERYQSALTLADELSKVQSGVAVNQVETRIPDKSVPKAPAAVPYLLISLSVVFVALGAGAYFILSPSQIKAPADRSIPQDDPKVEIFPRPNSEKFKSNRPADSPFLLRGTYEKGREYHFRY